MTGRRSSVGRMCTALATTALVGLGGCTTLGGNVKGSFSCAAPDGICAPSSSIDDRALAMIAGESGGGEAMPAAPVADPGSRPRPTRTAATGPRVPVAQGDPRRTQERVLRIVFQPYIDEYGRLHEASAVHAVVESGAWQQQRLAASTPIPDLSAGPRPGAEASLSEAVDRADGVGAELSEIDPNLPDPAVVAAARARAPVVDPVAAIRNDVAARLAPKVGRTPPRVVTRSVPLPVERKPGGAAAAMSVAKGAQDAGAAKKGMAAGPTGAALAAKTKSAPDAVARVKASAEYQTRALDAEAAARAAATGNTAPAASSTAKAPVRAAGFPGAVTEDQ